MKIGIFTDTHYCELEMLEQDRKPKRAYDAVKTAFDEFKKQGVELAVCLGDLIHFNNGAEESIDHLNKISSLINSYGIPTYHCMGNHDSEVVSGEDFEKLTGFKVAPVVAENDEVKLIFLDASYTPEGEPYGREHIDWTRSYVPKKELEWLNKELETEKRATVFIHQNIDKNVECHHIVSNADEINEIITKHKVGHVYQGHYHYGAENIVNSVPYTTVRAMCRGLVCL
jgi:DNA repair exonuclease SbcCD nuclease subunit